jgi:hypothetical protein
MISVDGEQAISEAVSKLEEDWRNALSDKLQAELVAG